MAEDEFQRLCTLLNDLRVQVARLEASIQALGSRLDRHVEQDSIMLSRHEAAIQTSFDYHREADRFQSRLIGIGTTIVLVITAGAGWLILS